jgi:hypothetical protein
MEVVEIPSVNTPIDFQHWYIARSRKELKRGERICFLGERRTFVYTVMSRGLSADSVLVRYRKEGWKRERTTVIHGVSKWLERGIILIHDGSKSNG